MTIAKQVFLTMAAQEIRLATGLEFNTPNGLVILDRRLKGKSVNELIAEINAQNPTPLITPDVFAAVISSITANAARDVKQAKRSK